MGIVSHILPPSPSGQAMVLYRLLEGVPRERYFLISREDYGGTKDASSASEKLCGRYYLLTPPRAIRSTGIPGISGAVASLNARIAVRHRARQIADIARREGCGVLVGCTGDMYDLPATALAARWAGVPFVPYIFDDYIHHWTGTSRRIAARLEPVALRTARAVIVPNEHTQKEYERRCGIRGTIVRNPCPMPDLEELDRAERTFDPCAVHIVYTGAVYHANSDAFRNLIAAIPKLAPAKILLHIFTAQSVADLERHGICGPMVTHHPHIHQSEVPRVLRHADILFLPLAFRSPIQEVIRTSAPGKMGEYLSVRRPILVHAPGDSFVSWYFRANRCGIVVDREDPGILAGAINRLLEDETLRGEVTGNARQAAERDYRVAHARKVFHELMNSVAAAL
jgi:glycosyltransferase involved in cell wall biosynthesis